VVDLEGRAVDPLASDAGPTVLVFVSTVCPIANRYAPTLAQLGSEWSGTSVRAWLVYPDPDEDAAAIEAHRSAFDLDWPALRDPAHRLVARSHRKRPCSRRARTRPRIVAASTIG
jgi:hypothetical protein